MVCALQHKHKLGCLKSYTAWSSTIFLSIKVCGKARQRGVPAIGMGKQHSAEFLWLPFLSRTAVWCCPFPPIFMPSGGCGSKTKPENTQLLLLQQATQEGLYQKCRCLILSSWWWLCLSMAVFYFKKSSALHSQEISKNIFWMHCHLARFVFTSCGTSVIHKMKNVTNTVNQTPPVGVHLPQEAVVVSALKSWQPQLWKKWHRDRARGQIRYCCLCPAYFISHSCILTFQPTNWDQYQC